MTKSGPTAALGTAVSHGFGARPVRGGVRFRVWAPAADELALVIHDGVARGEYRLPRDEEGAFDLIVDRAAAGDRYAYRIDGGDCRPDPASRLQPEGVHGPSEIVDPSGFQWTDTRWSGRPARDRIVYELHVGTFSPEGTFAGAQSRLEALRAVGVTAVELMPVADFAGGRNWGYDGVCLYAPSRAYGRPDDLRRLVDRAHRLGMEVIFDVVYNHLGPEGAYLPAFNDQYFTTRHATPWGPSVNLDGPGATMVRRFIVDNARHWIAEYHADGLRLDATHALIERDNGAIIREIVSAARSAAPRPVFIHAEDHRNLAVMIDDQAAGGWGLEGVWADDFHHIVRRSVAGDTAGYYADFGGTIDELVRTIQRGWLFTGQSSMHLGAGRGTDPSAVPMYRFVICIQNHDQIGNRAFGDRLHHRVTPDCWRAASALLLMAPMTPLLFMGQEWAASTPFQYFTDLDPSLGRQVTEGRRREFAHFPEFADEQMRQSIPDPQASSTFDASRLDWDERAQPSHRAVLELYRALTGLRLDYPGALGASFETAGHAVALDNQTLAMRRADEDDVFWVVIRLRGAGCADLSAVIADAGDTNAEWVVVLTTEDPVFAPDSIPMFVDERGGPLVRFGRAGAVILKKK
jgi:maltooligosyltrehalose trehalohydrolase